jgi:hypothetical protein
MSVAATLGAWWGRGERCGGEGDEAVGSLHGRPGVGWPNRGGFILGSGLHREQPAQLPGGKLAVLSGCLEVPGGLGVLASPDVRVRTAEMASAARMPACTAFPTAAVLLVSSSES